MMVSKNSYNDKKEIITLFESIKSVTVSCYQGHQIHFHAPEVEDEEGRIISASYIVKIYFSCKYVNLWFSFSNIKEPLLRIFCVFADITDNNYSFPLDDYLGCREIPVDKNVLLHHKQLHDYESIDVMMMEYYTELNKIIETEEMQRILDSSDKINIPRDWSRCVYK